MSRVITWRDTTYYIHGPGGSLGSDTFGNLFAYEDCCVWAVTSRGLADHVVHLSLEDRVAMGEEQAKLAPDELVAQDGRNWKVMRADIRHGYLYLSEGTISYGAPGSGAPQRTVFHTRLKLELADGSWRHLIWTYDHPEEREANWPYAWETWLGEVWVNGAPPHPTAGERVSKLLHRPAD